MANWYKESDIYNDIIVSSRVRLARNLANMTFPARMDETALKELTGKVKAALEQIAAQGGVRLKFIFMDDIPENEIYAMVERHVISPNFARNFHNRAIAISEDESISIMIGEEDHIRIQVTLPGDNLDTAYKMADQIDTALAEILPIAFSETLGFLTECPTNIGTGLRASVMLHLPVCESRGVINSISETASKIGLTIRGMYGEGSKAVASLYQISNQITLGISEKNAIENLKVIAEQIVEREKQNRMLLERAELEDTVMRAYGTLKYAKLISTEEFMKLISLIKLGLSEGIIENSNILPIRLLIEAQPHMLIRKYSATTPKERDLARAKMANEILK